MYVCMYVCMYVRIYCPFAFCPPSLYQSILISVSLGLILIWYWCIFSFPLIVIFFSSPKDFYRLACMAEECIIVSVSFLFLFFTPCSLLLSSSSFPLFFSLHGYIYSTLFRHFSSPSFSTFLHVRRSCMLTPTREPILVRPRLAFSLSLIALETRPTFLIFS